MGVEKLSDLAEVVKVLSVEECKGLDLVFVGIAAVMREY